MGKEQAPADEVRALVRAARAGDAAAFRRLVEMHMRAVYAVAHRMLGQADDADDVAQETFVRAHQALERYDERYSFYTWLRTIATRLALHEIDRRRRRRTSGGEAFDAAVEQVASRAPDPVQAAAAAEAQASLAAALAQLPPDFRAVLVLRAFEELSYDEIARELDIPVGTVMSRLARARRLLRAAWPAAGQTEASRGGKA